MRVIHRCGLYTEFKNNFLHFQEVRVIHRCGLYTGNYGRCKTYIFMYLKSLDRTFCLFIDLFIVHFNFVFYFLISSFSKTYYKLLSHKCGLYTDFENIFSFILGVWLIHRCCLSPEITVCLFQYKNFDNIYQLQTKELKDIHVDHTYLINSIIYIDKK